MKKDYTELECEENMKCIILLEWEGSRKELKYF